MQYGGLFVNELDAAKRVNQLCDEFGIKQKNSGINSNLTTEVPGVTIIISYCKIFKRYAKLCKLFMNKKHILFDIILSKNC